MTNRNRPSNRNGRAISSQTFYHEDDDFIVAIREWDEDA